LPRWLRALGVAVGGGVLAALVATQLSGAPNGARVAAPPTAAPTKTPENFGASQVLDVLISGGTEWLLEGRALVRVGAGRVVQRTSLHSLDFPVTSVPRLALDVATHTIWLVVENAAPTRMIQIDTNTMKVVRRLRWDQTVYGAVALDGYLFLANDFGVAQLPPGGVRPRVVAGLRGAVGPIALDQGRHRILALDASTPMALWSYRPGERPRESQRLALSNGSVAVVGGRIWLGGYSADGAVLYRLDPRTLAPLAGGPAPTFDPGAIVVAGGAHVVWVRNGGVSNLLACVDASTGRIEQRWRLPGAGVVASSNGTAVVATDEGVLSLVLVGCAG
jgi:outer membrane protein assembly factor BamB